MKNSTTTPSSQNSLSDIPTGELLKTYRARRKANPHKYYVPNGKVEEFVRMVGKNETFISLFSAANGVGKTAGGAYMTAHIVFGPSGNEYFDKLPSTPSFRTQNSGASCRTRPRSSRPSFPS